MTLGTATYDDWCRPSTSFTEYDLGGSAVAQSIVAIPGELFIVTGSNASSYAFMDMSVTSASPPVTATIGTYNNGKANDVFAEADYAYLATDTTNEEIVILDISVTPFLRIGWFDAP